jgi:serine/threonine-protein kinase
MVGQNIGKYRVLDRIGRGGMGTVYRAIDETLHREVAIKVLNAELNDPSVARRFRAEAVTVARLNHPGIATVYELFQHEGQWLMVMEFVRGETLEALVVRKGMLSPNEAAELSMQALGALAHAHSLGVVHRDLKPANIMVTDASSVKIMDFGIARVVGTEHLTSAGFMMGTPAYMAPEQVLGEDIDARADLYAMGVVLYHLVTGQLPFKGSTPFEMANSRLRDQPTPVRSIRAELPEWLGQVLTFSLHRDPASRFQSAPAFREALRRGLADLPLETPEAAAIPPELIATAAPSSMAVPAVGPATTPSSPPVRVEVPKATPPAPVEPVEPVRPPASTPARATPSGRGLWVGVAAVVVVIGGFAAWIATRPAGTPAVATVAEPAPPDPVAAAPATPPPGETAPAPAEPVAGAPVTPTPAPPAAGAGDAVSAPGGSAPPGAPLAASDPAARGEAPARGASSRAGAAAGATGRAGRGPSADAPLEFKDVRLLVVSGSRAQERTGVLVFGGGRVAVAGEDTGATLSALSYSEVTHAMYTRGRDPKWSPVLAGPPANVDLPSNVFSPARHWLTLQSRAAFLIVRLNDQIWTEVLETVTARTGLPVERPDTGGK